MPGHRVGVQVLPARSSPPIHPKGTCKFCGGPLPPRKRKWCKDACYWEYRFHHRPIKMYWAEFASGILRRDGFKCALCGSKGSLHVHHIVPISKGGPEFDPKNCQALCEDCHHVKHHRRYLEPTTHSKSTTLLDFDIPMKPIDIPKPSKG